MNTCDSIITSIIYNVGAGGTYFRGRDGSSTMNALLKYNHLATEVRNDYNHLQKVNFLSVPENLYRDSQQLFEFVKILNFVLKS